MLGKVYILIFILLLATIQAERINLNKEFNFNFSNSNEILFRLKVTQKISTAEAVDVGSNSPSLMWTHKSTFAVGGLENVGFIPHQDFLIPSWVG